MSVCPAGQGQDRAVRTFAVLVRRRLVHTDNIQTDTGQTIFEHNPDGQTPDSLFSKNPDKIPTADRIEVEKIRTDRHRTAFFLKIRTESGQRTDSRQTKSGQTDTGQKIRTESGQQTDTGQDFPENPDKNETRTGHGQCCPPTSASHVLHLNKYLTNVNQLQYNELNLTIDVEVFTKIQEQGRVILGRPMEPLSDYRG